MHHLSLTGCFGWCTLQSLVQEGMAPAEAAERIAQLRRDCEGVIGECLEAVSSELSFFTLPSCFELFGFDLLVTASLEGSGL